MSNEGDSSSPASSPGVGAPRQRSPSASSSQPTSKRLALTFSESEDSDDNVDGGRAAESEGNGNSQQYSEDVTSFAARNSEHQACAAAIDVGGAGGGVSGREEEKLAEIKKIIDAFAAKAKEFSNPAGVADYLAEALLKDDGNDANERTCFFFFPSSNSFVVRALFKLLFLLPFSTAPSSAFEAAASCPPASARCT